MEALAQLCFDYRDVGLRWSNDKEIVDKDCDVCALVVMEYAIVGCERFEIDCLKVGRKGEISNTR